MVSTWDCKRNRADRELYNRVPGVGSGFAVGRATRPVPAEKTALLAVGLVCVRAVPAQMYMLVRYVHTYKNVQR